MKKLSILALVMLGGCAADEPSESSTVQALAGCDPLVCPGNSNLLGVLGPYELDETGVQFSPRGYRIAGMWHGAAAVSDLDVPGAALEATTGAGLLSGPGLIGLRLRIEHSSGGAFELQIDGYLTAKVPYYVGGPNEIEGYHVVYRMAGERETHELCPYETYNDAGVPGTWAVFWKGDRYDPDTGLITASNAGVGPWFNISCAGEATIKMLRARTGGAVAPASPVAQRQATLNMFTAAYCGPTGQRYTKLGVPLAWSDLSGPSAIGAVSSREAVWNEDGAVCLDTPRLYSLAEIDCSIPTCTATTNASWPLLGWSLSGTP